MFFLLFVFACSLDVCFINNILINDDYLMYLDVCQRCFYKLSRMSYILYIIAI